MVMKARGASSPEAEGREHMIKRDLPYDEMRREYVAELLKRRTQIQARQKAETDPNERIRLRNALVDIATELDWMATLVAGLEGAGEPQPETCDLITSDLVASVKQKLKARGTSLLAWCRSHKVARVHLAAALRGEDVSKSVKRSASKLLVELGMREQKQGLKSSGRVEDNNGAVLLEAIRVELHVRGSSLEQWCREHGMRRGTELATSIRNGAPRWKHWKHLQSLRQELGITGNLPMPQRL